MVISSESAEAIHSSWSTGLFRRTVQVKKKNIKRLYARMLEVCTWVTQQTHPSHLDKMVYSIDKNAAEREREREKKTDEWETRSMGRTKTEEKKNR